MFAPSTTTRSVRRPSAIARGLRVAAYAVANWTVSIVRGYLNRRTALEMMHFDERMLKDIGLTRGDVHASIIEPMGADPTVRLRILAGYLVLVSAGTLFIAISLARPDAIAAAQPQVTS